MACRILFNSKTWAADQQGDPAAQEGEGDTGRGEGDEVEAVFGAGAFVLLPETID